MSEQDLTWIEQLNNRAMQYQEGGMDSYGAVEQAAIDFKLSLLADGDVCRVYQTPDGTLVNCWVEETRSNKAQPGSRFDNNIQWYTRKMDRP